MYYGKQIHHKMISDQEMTCRSSVYFIFLMSKSYFRTLVRTLQRSTEY